MIPEDVEELEEAEVELEEEALEPEVVVEPEGPERASQITLAEAELLCAVMSAIFSSHRRTVEVFLYKDAKRYGGSSADISYAATRKPFQKSNREVKSKELFECHAVLDSWLGFFRLATWEVKKVREEAISRGFVNNLHLPALNNEDFNYLSEMWGRAIKGFEYARKIFRDYCQEATREEISYCYSLIEENKKDTSATLARGGRLDPKKTRLMNDWANYLRIVQLTAQFNPDSLQLDCVFDVCDAFRIVSQSYIGAFMRKTAWHYVGVLDEHVVDSTVVAKWAAKYQKAGCVWHQGEVPIWSPRLVFNAVVRAMEVLGVNQLSYYNMIRSSLAYVTKYVYGGQGNLWRKQVIHMLDRGRLCEAVLQCHKSLGKLLPVIRKLRRIYSEIPENMYEDWYNPEIEALATKEVFNYWKESSQFSEKIVTGRNAALCDMLKDEYTIQDELMTDVINDFTLDYITLLSTKRMDLPEFFEGPLFKMYQQITYIYEGMHEEIKKVLQVLQPNNIWLLELPRRGFLFVKLVCSFVTDSIKAKKATTRKTETCYPKFIMGRLPMTDWARDNLLDHYEEEARKVAAARLAAEEERVRRATKGRKRSMPKVIKVRQVKSPEKPKDLPENPPPWPKRDKPGGPHFWPERVPCTWYIPALTIEDWGSPQGMLQMKYEAEDMAESMFRTLLMEAMHRQAPAPNR